MSRPSNSDPEALEKGLAEEARRDPRAAARRARRLRARMAGPAGRARMLRAEGSALHALGRHREALRAYGRARAAFLRLRSPRDAARVDLGRADVLVQLGRPGPALAVAEAARRAFLGAGARVQAAMADANAAGVAWRLDRPAPARDRYLRARAVFEAEGHRFGTAVCDLNVANCLASLDDRDGAAAAYARAREAFGALDMPALRAQADYNEAWLRATEDRPGEALALLARAEAAFRGLGDERHLALVATDRGEVRLRCGLLPEAAEDLGRAEAALGRLGLGADRARALSLLGCARALAGDGAGARAALSGAAALFRRQGNAAGGALVDLYRALAALRSGRDPSAPAARAARVFRRLGFRAREAQALLVGAEARGDAAAAGRALARVRGLRAPGLAFAAERVRARAAREAGLRPAAARAFAAALAEAERLREGLTADEMRLAFLRDREGFFEECARFLLEEGGPLAPGRALEVLERGRGRALLDLALFGTAAAPPGGPEVERLREALRFACNRMAGAGGERLRGPVDGARLRRLEARLAAALRGAGETTGAAPPLDEAGLRALVPADASAVSFLLGPRDGVALVARREGVAVVEGLPGRERAREAAAALRHEMERALLGGGFASRHAARIREDAEEAMAALRREFLDPVLPAAPGRRLVVAPHGPLHGVPFPALLPERIVSVTPSLAFLGPREEGAAGEALVVGVPDGGAEAAGEEVRRVAARLPGAGLLEGAAATLVAFRGRAPGARHLHLATHGVFRSDNPLASALRLADGWLTAHEVLGMRLGARLAVLSCCESGSPEAAPGDEAMGLARGFLGAGVRALVASLWRVPDAATAGLMDVLYDGLASGLPVDEALRDAQAAARGRGDHPAAWAAFLPLGPAVRIAGPGPNP